MLCTTLCSTGTLAVSRPDERISPKPHQSLLAAAVLRSRRETIEASGTSASVSGLSLRMVARRLIATQVQRLETGHALTPVRPVRISRPHLKPNASSHKLPPRRAS